MMLHFGYRSDERQKMRATINRTDGGEGRGGVGGQRLAVAGFFRTRLLKDAARHSTPFPDYIDLNSIFFPLVHVTALTPTSRPKSHPQVPAR